MRFVIADDHPLYLEAITGQISRAFEDSEVHACGELDNALEALSLKPTDLLMLDFSMPGMHGEEGVRKAVQAAGKTPVAILSGVAMRRTSQSASRRAPAAFSPRQWIPAC